MKSFFSKFSSRKTLSTVNMTKEELEDFLIAAALNNMVYYCKEGLEIIRNLKGRDLTENDEISDTIPSDYFTNEQTRLEFGNQDILKVEEKIMNKMHIEALEQNSIDQVALVAKNQETIIICFRGTSDLDSAIDNLQMLDMVPLPYQKQENGLIKVRAEFIENYEQVRETVLKLVEERSNNQKIILTGHSQGTAIAEICALDLRLKFGKDFDLSVMNICPVPGGNQEFSVLLHNQVSDYTAIYMKEDFVAKLIERIFPWYDEKERCCYRHIQIKPPKTNWSVVNIHFAWSYFNALKDSKKYLKSSENYKRKIIL